MVQQIEESTIESDDSDYSCLSDKVTKENEDTDHSCLSTELLFQIKTVVFVINDKETFDVVKMFLKGYI